MNWKSTAATGVVGGTLATLLATASPTVVRQRQATSPDGANHTEPGAALTVEIDKLRDRMHSPGPITRSTRNPFAFDSAARVPEPARPAPNTDASAPPPPTRPPFGFTLVGIAEDRAAEGAAFTAILSSPDALQFVKAGDSVAGRYRVQTITPDSVALVADDGERVLLRMR